jgi:two-component system, cell cycle response regulator
LLLKAGAENGGRSGLLLVRVDKLDQLKARFGHGGAGHFLQKMAGVLVRAIREPDLVCRFSEDTFAVLVPCIEADAARRLADAIRNAVRHHTFRLNADGPEVLVTASFGCTCCLPDDAPDLALDRVADALSRSQRRGRNQLHFHDGGNTAHLVTG